MVNMLFYEDKISIFCLIETLYVYDIFILMYMYSQCLVMCIWKSSGMIACFISENHLVNYEFYIRVLLKIAKCNFLQKIY